MSGIVKLSSSVFGYGVRKRPISTVVTLVSFVPSEFPAPASWSEPAWRHKQVRWHGQEGDQQTAETEGEEERVGRKRRRRRRRGDL